MPGKAETKVPYTLTVDTRPAISVDLGTTIRLTVRGKKGHVIAHVSFTARNLEVRGSDESKPMKLPYEYLKKRGIDELRDHVRETIRRR